MSTIQCIGARYVPKFFDWNGSAEWRTGVAYEALTIVTRNGNSYTSKIPVPSNIGAPESNPKYWVSTGLFNEQVEEYRQLAEGTATTLSGFMADGAIGTNNLANGAVSTSKIADGGVTAGKLAPKYIINVGDSYQAGYDPAGNNKGWGAYLLSMFGYNGHNIPGVGGAGFGKGANSPKDFATILSNNPPTDIDYDKVTDIVVGCGYNDFHATSVAIDDGISRFYTHCRSRYPNARIWVAPAGWAWTNNENHITPKMVGDTFRSYIRSCQNRKINVVNSCLGVLFGCNGLSTEDYKHPTETGNKAIASAINAAFNGLPYLSQGAYYNLPFTGEGWSGGISVEATTINGIANMRIMANNIEYNGTEISLSAVPITFARHPIMFACACLIGSMGKFDGRYINAAITFYAKSSSDCDLGMYIINSDGTAYLKSSNFKLIGSGSYICSFSTDVIHA